MLQHILFSFEQRITSVCMSSEEQSEGATEGG